MMFIALKLATTSSRWFTASTKECTSPLSALVLDGRASVIVILT